jgi:radical SAM enzyme (TIGR01210 family)
MTTYPASSIERDQWIHERRGARNSLDPSRPYAFLLEKERFANGEVGNVATIFLTNRECPWRCAMCDLWRNTLSQSLAPGYIPRQIEFALSKLPPARQIKLYNSGSFFDPLAIPVEDYPAIAELINRFERVIVESHPALIGERCFSFQSMLSGKLEVAMGLETAHATVLEKLNKRMTLAQYASSADRLRERDIDLRAFILVRPPFMHEKDAVEWACRSVDFAFDYGATAVSLIPTRGGNGATDTLATQGQFDPPTLSMLEDSFDYSIGVQRGRAFVDLWDDAGIACNCFDRKSRLDRLATMNLSQRCISRFGSCGDGGTP